MSYPIRNASGRAAAGGGVVVGAVGNFNGKGIVASQGMLLLTACSFTQNSRSDQASGPGP
jgi:hypothetical protein